MRKDANECPSISCAAEFEEDDQARRIGPDQSIPNRRDVIPLSAQFQVARNLQREPSILPRETDGHAVSHIRLVPVMRAREITLANASDEVIRDE